MTTLSQIITDAYRASNLIGISASVTSAEQTEALRLLKRIIPELIGYEAGDPLEDVPVGSGSTRYLILPETATGEDYASYYIPSNSRLLCTLTAATSVTLPPVPEDGSRLAVVDNAGNFATYNLTLNGNGRNVGGSATATLSTNSMTREYFYRADLGNWLQVDTFTVDSDSPFPQEFDTVLILALSLRLLSSHGQVMSNENAISLRKGLAKLSARYFTQKVTPSEAGLSRTVLLRGYSGWNGLPSFSRGY